jgi:cyclopropane-fatty-acyl-phospholipid synthase
MSRTLAADRETLSLARPASLLTRLARRTVLAKLAGLQRGRLILEEGDRRLVFGPDDESGLEARILVQDPSFYAAVALGGSIGAGESFAAGAWTTPDLTAVIRVMALNPELGSDLEGGLARLKNPFRRLLHRLHAGSRGGSRRNIAAHYDLGNEFFAAFLDPTLTYSCGYFETPESTMQEASIAKYERLCRSLELSEGDEVLEIGCGWGGFALHAAMNHGCRVTATTISEQQYRFARERVRRAGMEDRVEIIRVDYRDLPGRLHRKFDRVVSIEMIEAVGHRFLDRYFESCSRMLRPHGRMGLQAITIADQQYERYRRSVDFIQRHIFPGGLVPSVTAMSASITRATDMRIVELEDIGAHYARTLKLWRERFLQNLGRIRGLGYPEEFLRLWEFYFCYCEGGFRERSIGTVQIVLAKPGFRNPIDETGGAS